MLQIRLRTMASWMLSLRFHQETKLSPSAPFRSEFLLSFFMFIKNYNQDREFHSYKFKVPHSSNNELKLK